MTGREFLSFGLAALGLFLLSLSIDSWLFAGQFLHAATNTPSQLSGELIGGLVALGVTANKSRNVDHFMAIGLSLIALFLLGSAAAVFFHVAHIPPAIAMLGPKVDGMLIAGIIAACAAGNFR